jgi:gamma-glutamylcyclotransferase (GGCT)/AIG2-like uncharacterized protein YtfP
MKSGIVQELLERGKKTPDFHELRKYTNILVFVHDDFKSGQNQNDALKGAKYLGEATTVSENFTMKSEVFPVVFENNIKSSRTRAKVRGEVYAVTPEHILYMDMKRNNGIVYKRVKKAVLMHDQEYGTLKGNRRPYGLCQMYLGVENFWEGNDKLTVHPKIVDVANPKIQYFDYCGGRATTKTSAQYPLGSLLDEDPHDYSPWGEYARQVQGGY